MAKLEIFYGVVANRFRVRTSELFKEPGVAVFAFKAESVRVVRKQVGTAGLAEIVLMQFYVLGKDNSLCRSDFFGIVFCKVALWCESKIFIPLDTGMERNDHFYQYLMPNS
jgi:hypothetical protein